MRTKSARIIARLACLPLLAVVALGGFGCKTVDKEVRQATKPFTIKYWRVFEGSDVFGDVLLQFKARYPHITIDYRKFRYDEYEKELLNAMAEGRGPDVFSLHNTWLREWQPRLLPAPPVLSVPFREVKGSIKKEVIITIRQIPGMTIRQLANDFVDVVGYDSIMPTEQADPRAPLVPRVYGLPLSVDTMVMYYNRDILNANGIAKPASHWLEFQEHVKKVTKLDEVGTVIQPAASIGTADNVERSADLLSVLMMQNGAQMADEDGIATFDKYPPELAGRNLPPGAEALIFYTDFANPEKEVYTWNDKMPDSLQAFISGKTAYFFGYSYHLQTIRNSAQNLNFGIAPLPQIQGNQPINYANYWLEVVSEKTEHPDEVWAFVQFVTEAAQAQKYLANTGKPTALRSLINPQLEDIDLSVFASQLPTALSWYRGTDAAVTEETFRDMIRQMLSGEEPDPTRIVNLGATKVNQTVE